MGLNLILTANNSPVTVGGGVSLYAGYTPTVVVTSASELASALSAAAAGTVIGVDPGVYTGSNTNSKLTPAWRCDVSGSSGSPIVIVAKYPAAHLASPGSDPNRSELRSGGTAGTNAGCPAFGVYSQSHQRWIGFYVDENASGTHSDTGPVVLWDTTGSYVQKCVIVGDSTPGWTSDNHNGIRIEESTFSGGLDNRISGFTGDSHASGVTVYASNNIEVAYNEISGCYSGVYFKGDTGIAPIQSPAAIHHNIIHTSTFGLQFGGIKPVSPGGGERCNVYQNIVYNCGEYVHWRMFDSLSPSGVRIVNNTFYGASGGGLNGGAWTSTHWNTGVVPTTSYALTLCQEWNNIYSGATTVHAPGLLSSITAAVYCGSAHKTHDHNCYDDVTYVANLSGSGNLSFAAWQALPEAPDANGINADPLFVTPGSDFRLQAGSPCLNAGSDVLGLAGGGAINIGAYITAGQTDVIGVRP